MQSMWMWLLFIVTVFITFAGCPEDGGSGVCGTVSAVWSQATEQVESL